MATGFLRRGMTLLGLIDDEYEEDGVPMPAEHLDPPLTSRNSRVAEGLSSTMRMRALAPGEREPNPNVSVLTARKVRARSTELSPHIRAFAPVEFGDARQIADGVMAGQPVIVNLQTAGRELKRRMIDFCSGVTYGLGGGMERIADNVFLITPSNIEPSADERRRA